MRIGLSSAVFYPQKSEDSISKLIEMGFTSAEFFYNCEYEISDEFANVIKSLNKDNTTKFISVHPFTAFAESVFFFSEYERRTEEQLNKYKHSFDTAKCIGADFFTFHGDRAYKGLDDSFCVFSDRNFKSLSALCEVARDSGITLCLENVSWCKSSNINYLRNVANKIDNVGFTLDLKQARRAKFDYHEYLDIMAPKLKNIHISDFDENNDCLLPGEGKFDFRSFMREIKSYGYSGDVIIEVYSSNYKNESQILSSKKFLEDIINV